MATAVLLTRVL